jgi:hypothetical protein
MLYKANVHKEDFADMHLSAEQIKNERLLTFTT